MHQPVQRAHLVRSSTRRYWRPWVGSRAKFLKNPTDLFGSVGAARQVVNRLIEQLSSSPKPWLLFVASSHLLDRFYRRRDRVPVWPPASTLRCIALLAQLAEQLTLNQRAVGSSPTAPTKVFH